MRAAIAAPLCAGILCVMALSADEMNLVKLHVDSFTVVGIESRTTNARETTADSVIGPLWARFTSENLLSRIPHRVDDRIVTVYSDYESDKDGPYSYTLGAKVSSLPQDLPPGMVSRKVLSGDYAMFTAQGGSPQQMTVDLWKRIWSLEGPPRHLHRAFRTDFEVHYDGGVDIYIGLRK